ncbi:aminotransferase [Pseudaminobacter sp. 19-2017]|uniref:aspartate transaminase n=1 Tax=Pseudaminobacter soli (ex Zhang et al. 2022) TaxID=2831468 RepID=A0A942E469_9HYPH|nr:aminotransferase [Pseudaminobacter soli]MBS3650265.1 aminotransferase [Pseudaminobacter soli]
MPPFNAHVDRLAPPAVPAVQAWAREYRDGLGPLIDMSQAVPGYPPHPDMLRFLAEEAGSTRNTGYGDIEGEPALRTAYAADSARLYRAQIGAENVHITSGCNQAFVVSALAVAGPGDAVLAVNPVYFNHESTLRMLGIRVATVDGRAADGFLPSVEAIEKALTPDVRAVALVSPNNPTGAVYPPDLLKAIFELCRREKRWLILDETYRDFLPDGGQPPHGLFAKADWEQNLIGLYSFSKSFCIPGHRLGAITAGTALVAQVAKIMDNLQICAPRAAQAALARAIPILDDWRQANRVTIQSRTAVLKAVIAQCPGWEIDAIGAYFAYIRHPLEGLDSIAVSERLAKEAGVVTIPGGFFGPGQERHLRFAFANAVEETISLLPDRLRAV